MSYRFEVAQETDAPGIFSLYQSLIGTPGCTWNEDYPTIALVARDIQTGSLYVLKEERGTVIAAASAGPDDELAEFGWDLDTPCELARVAVSASLQNKGVGSCLLKQVVAAVKARGFDGIRMLVSVDHPHALALYDKNGFERLDTVRMYGHVFYRYRMAF